jgi:hypothetical protein
VYASEGFSRYTGYSKEEIEGRNCRFLQGKDSNPKDVEKIKAAINEKHEVTLTLDPNSNHKPNPKPNPKPNSNLTLTLTLPLTLILPRRFHCVYLTTKKMVHPFLIRLGLGLGFLRWIFCVPFFILFFHFPSRFCFLSLLQS